MLHSTLFAHSPTSALLLCWHGFADPHSGVPSFEYALGRAELGFATLTPRAVDAAESLAFGAQHALANASGVAGMRCVEPEVSMIAGETYALYVAARSGAGVRSDWARATIIADATSPQFAKDTDFTPVGTLTVHTGGTSANVQVRV